MPLSAFHPIVQSWFQRQVGQPTDAQQQAWPAIASGKHVLVVAPTGSGKTLAAFLWALDGLLTGRIPGGTCRILYVSPLRALNHDIQRNLLAPLVALRQDFLNAGQKVADVRVVTRSGDTPANERQRLVKHPPEILITTPESLNIMLTSRRAQSILSELHTVIIDEIHAVVGSKRGVHLITAIERLTLLSGEMQRIALSATVSPLKPVAAWMGGYQNLGRDSRGPYRRRNVTIVTSSAHKPYSLSVTFAPQPTQEQHPPDPPWSYLAGEIRKALHRHRATLVFANSKRMVEKLVRFVNESGQERIVGHHGALARETRAEVEESLKAGTIRGIVATNTLELGIDIGTLDEVLLVQSPASVASAMQRIGRAGHRVDEPSRATFLPITPADILEAAVMVRSVLDARLEPVKPIYGALDVLAQVIVSMLVVDSWTPESLHAFLRTSAPYHDLPRSQLDRVLEMLAGRYFLSRIRELRPIISFDPQEGILRARPGAGMLVCRSGGTIPDRGHYHLRHAESSALIGELDEEFVWERKVGDTFTLGVQCWRVERISHHDVFVLPSKSPGGLAPFWRGDTPSRSFEQSLAIGSFLKKSVRRLDNPAFFEELKARHGLDEPAARALIRYIKQQHRALGLLLPHRRRVIVEHVVGPGSEDDRAISILHASWGGAVLRPLALALQSAWEREIGGPLTVMSDDDCIGWQSEEHVSAEEIFTWISTDTVDELLGERLEQSGVFGARFREAAARALLLPRAGFGLRNPLWLSRVKGKRLFEAVAAFDDFPLIQEAWRECMQDVFDLDALRSVLTEIENGAIEVCTRYSSVASPFSRGVLWQQTNQLMYESDALQPTGKNHRHWMQEVVETPSLRPRISRELVERFERKLQRIEPGWSPCTALELYDWVVERGMIPEEQWQSLTNAMKRDSHLDPEAMASDLGPRIVRVRIEKNPSFVVAASSVPRFGPVFFKRQVAVSRLDGSPCSVEMGPETWKRGENLSSLLLDRLRFHGPVNWAEFVAPLGLSLDDSRAALEWLIEGQEVVVGLLTQEATEEQVCDRENYERLLRLKRAEARPTFEPRPVSQYPAFIASWQGLTQKSRGAEGLKTALDRLFGYPLDATLWETEVLPARVDDYRPGLMDSIFVENSIGWVGLGNPRLALLLPSDRELVMPDEPTAKTKELLESLFPHPTGKYTLTELQMHTKKPLMELQQQLWALAFKGWVSTDGFEAVRKGQDADKASTVEAPRAKRLPRNKARWAARPSGHWYRWQEVEPPANVVEQDEVERDRVRMLLDRWGIVCRSLLEREVPALRWSKVFRTLRLMELSGEVVAGQFFEGLPGIQFASPAALALLRQPTGQDTIAWMNAMDPASVCGLGLEGLEKLPRRVAGNHLAYCGGQLAVVSESRGRRLQIHLSPEDPRLPECLGFLKNLIERIVKPQRCVTVETINDEAASTSDYRPVLESMFHVVRDRNTLKLMRRYSE